MMDDLPFYVKIIFLFTAILTLLIFYKSTVQSKKTFYVLICWLLIQLFISISGFYTYTEAMPPRFLLLVLPPLFTIIFLFFSAKGKEYIDSLDIRHLTMLHTIRIPVEIVLYLLYLNGKVPELMTFSGRNFDILAGITAPLVFYFAFFKTVLNRKFVLYWNYIGLCLLLNIVVNGILSAPFQFQQFAFDQPNIAVLYFPFSWLPGFIVPVVLFSHLAAIRQLVNSRN